MDKALKIVGAAVVIFFAVSLVLWLIGKVFAGLFWIALIALGIWAVTAIANNKKRGQVGGYRR
ncbi:hypothetical protein FDO65_16830 [Nakamurella flava]|uniref:Uncharacterized protein n=1 Tax=Nakamurella flava TaxID=2576308 RepID=A0A4U6QCZ5_9ACTN|nr:hypothetical protein [Nakamurella flava]TKV57799.1 hypothetical protein FDO65_16830 [Nakamurella flava]